MANSAALYLQRSHGEWLVIAQRLPLDGEGVLARRDAEIIIGTLQGAYVVATGGDRYPFSALHIRGAIVDRLQIKAESAASQRQK